MTMAALRTTRLLARRLWNIAGALVAVALLVVVAAACGLGLAPNRLYEYLRHSARRSTANWIGHEG